jgi:hypothetical protein
MNYGFRTLVLLSLCATGCGGDDGGGTTTGVGDGTADSTGAATSGGMTTANASSGDTTGDATGNPTSSSSGGSGATDSGGATGSTGSSDTSATTGAVQTECGAELCDSGTEICVERAKGGPSSIGCEPVPAGCDADRTCNCVGVPLCTVGLMACTDVGDNVVFCDSGLD